MSVIQSRRFPPEPHDRSAAIVSGSCDISILPGWESRTATLAATARFHNISDEAKILLRLLWQECFGLAKARKREEIYAALRVLLRKNISDSTFRRYKQELVNANHPIGSTQDDGYWYCANNQEVALSNADKKTKIIELSSQIKQMAESGFALYGPQLPLL